MVSFWRRWHWWHDWTAWQPSTMPTDPDALLTLERHCTRCGKHQHLPYDPQANYW